ncbi:hypothetical protein SNEBB_003299 [Seison nebaliae]|nr:hypothetical protein SNEBB_003299 [Seison nebaliae]
MNYNIAYQVNSASQICRTEWQFLSKKSDKSGTVRPPLLVLPCREMECWLGADALAVILMFKLNGLTFDEISEKNVIEMSPSSTVPLFKCSNLLIAGYNSIYEFISIKNFHQNMMADNKDFLIYPYFTIINHTLRNCCLFQLFNNESSTEKMEKIFSRLYAWPLSSIMWNYNKWIYSKELKTHQLYHLTEEEINEQFKQLLTLIQNKLNRKKRKFLFGDQMTTADIIFYAYYLIIHYFSTDHISDDQEQPHPAINIFENFRKIIRTQFEYDEEFLKYIENFAYVFGRRDDEKKFPSHQMDETNEKNLLNSPNVQVKNERTIFNTGYNDDDDGGDVGKNWKIIAYIAKIIIFVSSIITIISATTLIVLASLSFSIGKFFERRSKSGEIEDNNEADIHDLAFTLSNLALPLGSLLVVLGIAGILQCFRRFWWPIFAYIVVSIAVIINTIILIIVVPKRIDHTIYSKQCKLCRYAITALLEPIREFGFVLITIELLLLILAILIAVKIIKQKNLNCESILGA